MDEIKLWTMESDGKNRSAIPVDTLPQLEAESQLEDLLTHSPDLLMPDLRLVGRQNPNKGGFLDLLGIDEDGNLVVFELKRGDLTREAIAQIVDYASSLAVMSPEDLAKRISEQSGDNGIEKIENFDDWYQDLYPDNPGGYTHTPRMVLVGLGADEPTQRMAEFLSQSGVNISLVTFYAFNSSGRVLLARHLNVAPSKPPNPPQGPTKASNMQALSSLSEKAGVKEFLDSAIAFVGSELHAYEWPNRTGYTFSLAERTEAGTPTYRAYVSLYVNEHKRKQVQLFFWKRAVDLAKPAFDEFQNKSPAKFAVTKSGNLEAWISSSEWEKIKEPLRSLLANIVDGWDRKSGEPK